MDSAERLVTYCERTGAKIVDLGSNGTCVRFRKGLKDAHKALQILDALRDLGSVDNLSIDQYERLKSQGLFLEGEGDRICPARGSYDRIDAYDARMQERGK